MVTHGLAALHLRYRGGAQRRWSWWTTATRSAAPARAGAKEYLTVPEGELRMEVPGGARALKAGETLRYRADQPHGIVNADGDAARALLVVEFR